MVIEHALIEWLTLVNQNLLSEHGRTLRSISATVPLENWHASGIQPERAAKLAVCYDLTNRIRFGLN